MGKRAWKRKDRDKEEGGGAKERNGEEGEGEGRRAARMK